ncbi:MAG TPA: GNAT family N-acetyltransferase [Thermoanaerobaculia bacterium]
MTAPDTPCDLLPWDSRHFGVRVGRVQGSRLDAALLARVQRWRDEQAIDCLYLLADPNDAATAPLAEGAGFRLVDVRVTLEGAAAADRDGDAAPGFEIREAREGDVAELRRLAAVSHHDSRFYYDGRFDRARCDELYALWIERACREETVLVAAASGRPVGYITCRIGDDGHGQIGLFAVAPEAQGKGLGGALIARSLAHCAARGASRVRVVTQGRNVRAQRIYQKLGLYTSAVELWFHGWREESEAR